MNIKKILVIRFRRIGDAVLSESICRSLRCSFPNAEIHYVLNDHIAPLFENHPDIDKLVTFSRYDMSSTLRYAKKVRRIMKENDYDVVIDTRSTLKTLLFSLFSLNTPYRIGRKKSYNRFIQNYRVDNRYNGTGDNVQLLLSLLDPLSRNFTVVKDPVFRLYCAEEEKTDFRRYMETKGVDFSKPVFVAAVSARLAHKTWSIGNMTELVRRILEKYNVQIVFNHADKHEKKHAEQIYCELGSPRQVFTDVEARNLRELMALLSNASFFFGNEGGPRHISQALNVPSFAIFSPSIPLENWLPNRSDRFQGVELKDINPAAAASKQLAPEEKYALIDIDSVWNRADKMLSELFSQKAG
ncbi:MAG: glycosyltransferase family 9 protein [Prevotella sp.]|nr:glycosyltransferase family 9 protein [Prevotella sp.]